MSSKPAPFTPFGASSTTSDSSIQPPASQNHSAFAGQSFGPGGIRSGPSIQRAPPLSASQNPQLSIGKPYRPGGVQSVPPINRIPSPSAFQNPSPSSGQPYQPGGIQRSDNLLLWLSFFFFTPYTCKGSSGTQNSEDGINQIFCFLWL
jgi:hypothetical protein